MFKLRWVRGGKLFQLHPVAIECCGCKSPFLSPLHWGNERWKRRLHLSSILFVKSKWGEPVPSNCCVTLTNKRLNSTQFPRQMGRPLSLIPSSILSVKVRHFFFLISSNFKFGAHCLNECIGQPKAYYNIYDVYDNNDSG